MKKSRSQTFWKTVLPAPRLAIYLAFGALLWPLSAIFPLFKILGALFLVGLIGVALLDLWLSPQPGHLQIWREFEAKMNLGTCNTVILSAKNRARRSVILHIRDAVPAAFTVQTDELPVFEGETRLPVAPRARLLVEANDVAQGEYRLLPNRRGDFEFGALVARYSTVLGLWNRQFERETPEKSARVFPDTSPIRRFEVALREGKMRDIGLHLLRFRGRGTEFESLREYAQGDEFKSINWKASARRGHLISTNYEIERDQTIVICLDCGRMMTSLAVSRTKSGAPVANEVALSKLDCSINAAVLLSHVSASLGDSVGLLLFSDGVLRWLAPRKGKIQTGQIIEALYATQPSLVEPDYRAAYEHLLSHRLRRAFVVTFTDLIDHEASRELLNASAILRKHHNALCVTINNGDVLEMARQKITEPSALYSKALAQKMLMERHTALESLRGVGVGILDVEASELSLQAVNRYLELKSRGLL